MTRAAVPRGIALLSFIATAILIVQVARMSVYMVDPAATAWSVMPWNEFGTRHNCPLSILGTFQGGNVQLACIAGSLLAMLWLERARSAPSPALLYAAGGLLLAYMTVSKLYPGMLIVYLLFRREWRAVAWTAAGCIVFAVAGLVDLGASAHLAFLDHLPRLLSGESFPNLRNPSGIAANMSVPGLARKLSIYGLPWSSFDAMRVVGWIYTLVVLAVVAWLARSRRSTTLEPIVWLVILLLATLRSPVLPVYGIFPTVWLLTILLAARWDSPVVRWLLLAWFVALALVTPAWTLWPPAVHAIVTTIVLTAGSLALAASVLRLELPLRSA